MSTSPTPECSEAVDGHSRKASKSNLPRRALRSPLPIHETPLSDPLTESPRNSPRGPVNISSGFTRASPREDRHSMAASPQPSFHTAKSTLTKDGSNLAASVEPDIRTCFPHLLERHTYHPIPTTNVLAPFATSSLQPRGDASLPDLLQSASYRHAAETCARLLTSPENSSMDHRKMFELLYTRLACLTLCGHLEMAAMESRALEDLGASIYWMHDAASGTQQHIVPWELRVLAVRLQSIGFGDVRRGIVGYYELAKEARAQIASLRRQLRDLGDSQAQQHVTARIESQLVGWEDRVEDLGIRTASALIEMDDLEGATCFLDTLPKHTKQLGFMRALLWLAVGDIDAAKNAIEPSQNPGHASSTTTDDRALEVTPTATETRTIQALCAVADNHLEAAATIFSSLAAQAPSDSSSSSSSSDSALYQQNEALCNLYLGNAIATRGVLEKLADHGARWHVLTFNLCTVYELCSGRAMQLKEDLARKLARVAETRAGADSDSTAWEKTVVDFKL